MKMRLLLFTTDPGTAQRMRAAAVSTTGCGLVTTGTEAETAERMFRDAFDALLLTDPALLRPAWRDRPLLWPRRIYLIGHAPVTPEIADKLTFCFPADSEPSAILSRITSLGPGQVRQTDREALASAFLQRIGVPVSLSGFRYLCEGVRYLSALDRLTDAGPIADLYAALAKQAGTNPSVAEHAMRHAIDTAWMRADPGMLMETFGNTVQSERAAPSNAAFLFRAAEQVLFERGEERV